MNAQQLLNQLTQAVTYRDLQESLKAAKAAGYEIGCKLNAKQSTLETARNTLVMEISRSLAVAEPEEADLTVTQIEESEQMLEESAKVVQALATEFEQVVEAEDEEPDWQKEEIALAADTSQPPVPPDEPEPATSIFNPVPAAFQPLVTAKWAWEYASRRASADTALCRRIASDALAATSLALQVASRAVAI